MILRDFTLKNIKLNKRRTIVTIIGIILSTALICCVAGMFTSFCKTMINSIIQQDGDFHVIIYEVNRKDIDNIKNYKEIKDIYLETNNGYYEDDVYGYVNINAKDDKLLSNYKLSLGRLPSNSSEILVNYNMRKLLDTTIISSSYDDNYDYEIEGNIVSEYVDDNVNLNTKAYKVVGVLDEKYWSNDAITKLDEDTDILNVRVKYKNIRNTYKNTKKLFNNYGVSYNKDLLNWNFVTKNDIAMNSLIIIVGIVLGIIVISSIFVIRNSFEISFTEKIKQYGMLSSIGATKSQIRKTVILEGLIIGLIGIPIGILLGYVVVHILILFSNFLLGDMIVDEMEFVVSVPLVAIVLSVLLGISTILLSSLKSAYKAGKVSPITAIRSNNEIKIKNKKLKTPKIINKLFGIGGVVAYKNLKRSKKKYRTTVISLVVSITIFISLYSFMDVLFGASKFIYKNIYFDMSITNSSDVIGYNVAEEDVLNVYREYSNKTKEYYNKILKFDGIDDYMIFKNYSIELKNHGIINLSAVGDHTYNKILKDLKLKYEDTKDKIIYIKNIYNRIGNKIIDNFDFKVKDILTLNYQDKEYNLEIVNINKLDKYDLQMYQSGDGIFLVSDELFDKIATDRESGCAELLIKSKNANNLEKLIKELDIDTLNIENYSQMAKYTNNIVLWISVFLYGFIIVISLIGVTNIFNTITTNMHLRSKEFAMLKSVGMTKKEFNKMIRLESIMYGLKSLIYGIILGTILSLLIYKALSQTIDLGYKFPTTAIIISIIFITLVVGLIMKYSLSKINKQNIIETIRQDNI